MRQLDFYEFTGILIPGTVVLLGALLNLSVHALPQSLLQISIGGFGALLLVAYALGHLVQAVGNVLEFCWWKLWSGMPTDWIRQHSSRLLSPAQLQTLHTSLASKLNLSIPKELSSLSQREWFAITRQLYAAVMSAGKASRIDVFNGNYGLMRGIASALILNLPLLPLGAVFNWKLAAVICGAIILAIARMHRFGVHYARELFVQFLQLPATHKS